MSININIGVLCNSRLAIPSLQALLSSRLTSHIGVPDTTAKPLEDIRRLVSAYSITPHSFSRSGLGESLRLWVEKHSIDVVLVFTFPWRIPESILTVPKFGFLNFHFGILPQYRGADAIFWPIKYKETHGGITVHKMDAQFDTGPILLSKKMPIDDNDTYGTLSAKLAQVAVPLLQNVLMSIAAGNASYKEQNNQDGAYYSKPQLKDIIIKWEKHSAADIKALVNACNPWNKGAYTLINNMPARITEVDISNKEAGDKQQGEITEISEQGICIATSDKKVIVAKIIALEEGIFSANRCAKIYNINVGQIFQTIR